jgi:chromosome segregation ATPase
MDTEDSDMCKIDNWTFDYFRKKLEAIERKLVELKKQGETQMAQIDDLNKAINDEDVELTTVMASIKKIASDVDALLAKIAAGGTPADLTAQITAIQSHLASLTTGAQQLVDADTKANA